MQQRKRQARSSRSKSLSVKDPGYKGILGVKDGVFVLLGDLQRGLQWGHSKLSIIISAHPDLSGAWTAHHILKSMFSAKPVRVVFFFFLLYFKLENKMQEELGRPDNDRSGISGNDIALVSGVEC